MWSIKMFGRIVLSCFMCVAIMTFSIYANDNISPKAPESQFAENNSTTLYPVQPISTWTNVGYALNAGVSFAHFSKYPYIHGFAYALVGAWALCVSISSGLFHASAGYGETGNLDVSSIFPYIVSIVWFEIWTLLIIYKGHCHRLQNLRHMYFRACDPPCEKCGSILFHTMFVIGTVGLFFMEFDKVVNIPWTTKFGIFGVSILVLFIFGVTIVFWSIYKGYVRRGQITIRYKQHIAFIGLMILVIIAFIVIGTTSETRKHGFISHMATSSAISIILIYSAVIYDNVLLH